MNADGIFAFPLTAGFSASVSMVWTGLNRNWEVADTCLDWTDNSTGTGTRGVSDLKTGTAISQTTSGCSQVRYTYCVEQ